MEHQVNNSSTPQPVPSPHQPFVAATVKSTSVTTMNDSSSHSRFAAGITNRTPVSSNSLVCDLCKISTNSAQQMELHLRGKNLIKIIPSHITIQIIHIWLWFKQNLANGNTGYHIGKTLHSASFRLETQKGRGKSNKTRGDGILTCACLSIASRFTIEYNFCQGSGNRGPGWRLQVQSLWLCPQFRLPATLGESSFYCLTIYLDFTH